MSSRRPRGAPWEKARVPGLTGSERFGDDLLFAVDDRSSTTCAPGW